MVAMLTLCDVIVFKKKPTVMEHWRHTHCSALLNILSPVDVYLKNDDVTKRKLVTDEIISIG